jgi:hypothetical protein
MTDRYRHLLDGHETEAADLAADLFSAYLASKTGAHAGAQQPDTAVLRGI